MKILFKPPIGSATGMIFGRKAGVYVRKNKKTGQLALCACPVRTKPPTPAQEACRQRFAEKQKQKAIAAALRKQQQNQLLTSN